MDNKGYILAEMLVTISILIVVIGGGLLFFPRVLIKIQAKQKTLEIAHFLHYARQLAIATHEDQVFTITPHALTLKDHSSIQIPHPLRISAKRVPGFTEVGHTKYSGTIKLYQSQLLNKVSLSPGYRKISWY